MKNKNLSLLLADDLSPISKFELRSSAICIYSGKIAQRLKIPIELVSVENLLYYPKGASPFKRLTDAYLREQEAKVLSLAKSFPVPTRGILIRGNPTKEIIKLGSKRKKYEMIVLGTSGQTGAQRLVLGSVAEEVIRHVQIPVMTIGPNAQNKAAQFLENQKIKILVPTSLTPHSHRAEAYAIELAKQLDAEMVIFHSMRDALPPLLKVAFANPHSVPALRDYYEETKDLLIKQLKRKADKAQKLGVTATSVLDDKLSSASESVLNEIERLKVTLVIMGTHGHSFASHLFFGRTLRDVILGAAVPIISVHSQKSKNEAT